MNKIKKSQIILILSIGSILYQYSSFGQNLVLKEKTYFSLPIKNNVMNYTIYPVDYKIEGVYKDANQSVNRYPEEVIISTLSAKNYIWDKNNYNYELKNKPEKYKLINNQKNKPQIVLKRKLNFETNNIEYAIIKYDILENAIANPSSFILIKKGDRWYISCLVLK